MLAWLRSSLVGLAWNENEIELCVESMATENVTYCPDMEDSYVVKVRAKRKP